jgi:hypothetical protein
MGRDASKCILQSQYYLHNKNEYAQDKKKTIDQYPS